MSSMSAMASLIEFRCRSLNLPDLIRRVSWAAASLTRRMSNKSRSAGPSSGRALARFVVPQRAADAQRMPRGGQGGALRRSRRACRKAGCYPEQRSSKSSHLKFLESKVSDS